jgi:hypothetical protein
MPRGTDVERSNHEHETVSKIQNRRETINVLGAHADYCIGAAIASKAQGAECA